MSKKAYIFLAQGFEITEALATVDILRRAKINACTISISTSTQVQSSNGTIVNADNTFNNINKTEADIIIIPGGIPGMNNLDSFKPLNDMICNFCKQGKLIAAICAGPAIFGHLGLLKGKEAICYPGFESELTDAKISDKRVVKDGNIITAKGMGATLEFALEIVKTLCGNDIAKQVAKTAIIA